MSDLWGVLSAMATAKSDELPALQTEYRRLKSAGWTVAYPEFTVPPWKVLNGRGHSVESKSGLTALRRTVANNVSLFHRHRKNPAAFNAVQRSWIIGRVATGETPAQIRAEWPWPVVPSSKAIAGQAYRDREWVKSVAGASELETARIVDRFFKEAE